MKRIRLRTLAVLLSITIGAILVHGYHPTVDDGELYLPAVKKALNPALYPSHDEFFMSHARMTFFDEAIAASIRLTHVPFDYAILLWHASCIFLMLAGCWRISRICFPDVKRAPLASTALIASLLTIPVAGTALYIMDPYLSPRDISTAGILLALADALERKYVRAAIVLALIATVHPLMPVFGIGLLILLYIESRRRAAAKPEAVPVVAMSLAAAIPFVKPVSRQYRNILNTSHSYFLVTRWAWYEWLGIVGPLIILQAFARYGERRRRREVMMLSRALITFGLVTLAFALLVSLPEFAALALSQPMRSLHLIFILMFVMGGGLLAESVLKQRAWRWVALFAPVCIGMFIAQRQVLPDTAHLEFPWGAQSNAWAKAFEWVRYNTPVNAVFALNPDYFQLEGENGHGFRALAERSAIASRHDRGAVSMFPALAQEWYEEDCAEQNWTHFAASDFEHLKQAYGVTWIVRKGPRPPDMNCPYVNQAVSVCRVE